MALDAKPINRQFFQSNAYSQLKLAADTARRCKFKIVGSNATGT